jgi:hypothetical protein
MNMTPFYEMPVAADVTIPTPGNTDNSTAHAPESGEDHDSEVHRPATPLPETFLG